MPDTSDRIVFPLVTRVDAYKQIGARCAMFSVFLHYDESAVLSDAAAEDLRSRIELLVNAELGR